MTDLTASEKHGRELFGQRCANCHTLKAANAIAEIGPNLDQLRPHKALVLDAIEKGRANGNGQMAANLYTGQDAEDVPRFVAKAVGRDRRSRPAADRLPRAMFLRTLQAGSRMPPEGLLQSGALTAEFPNQTGSGGPT